MAADLPSSPPGPSARDGPDFLCVGARKAGTTWLHRFCSDHPAFDMPEIKEINFFNSGLFKQALGYEVSADHIQAAIGRLPEPDRQAARADPLGWYRSVFATATGKSGDVSPLYSVLKKPLIQQIKATFPGLQIVILLRNPLDRIMSDTAMRSANQGVDINALDADQQMETLISWYGPVLSMREFIGRWRSVFGSALGIFFLDEISAAPEAFSQKFCDFMGVPHAPGVASAVINPNPGGSKKASLALKPAVRSKVKEIALGDLDSLAGDVPPALLAKWRSDVERFSAA